MARGWESKAVAEQMEEAAERQNDQVTSHEASLVVRARRVRIEYLRLSRARTLEQLKSATHPAHRTMLERTLTALDKDLEELKD